MTKKKNIQVIDGALNCTYDIFEASLEDFDEIFPAKGQDVEFIEDFLARIGKDRAREILSRLWTNRVAKKSVYGIHGTLFYELEHKKKYYPTKRENEAVTAIDSSDTAADRSVKE